MTDTPEHIRRDIEVTREGGATLASRGGRRVLGRRGQGKDVAGGVRTR
jgi:hypothetical protein